MNPFLSILRALTMTVLCGGAALASAATFDVAKLPPAVNRPVDFATEIKPLIEERCYNCHGAKRQEAGLRLDQKSGALKGGDSGPLFIPGKSGESLMVHAVSRLRDDLKMPKKGEPLTSAQVGLLRAWIDQGAKWPDALAAAENRAANHWAFKASTKPVLPPVKDKRWVRNPIDAFVLGKLEKTGLKPSPETDRITLIRRLALDLVGLPPSPKEVDAVLADRSPDPLKNYTERLLASAHYGEVWGRYWLDAARYADSDGYEKDMRRTMWNYRDYVINALNNDLPYNQFIIEQLAGDLLPNATQDQIVATGFLRNSMLNEEGGVDPEQFRMDAMFDRMDALGKSVLGLTIQCAQCHNHKFDPLQQEEYYKLFAFLNNDHEAQQVAYSPEDRAAISSIQKETTRLESLIKSRTPNWEAQLAQWETQVSTNQPEWIVLRPMVEEISTGGERYLPMDDGSFLALGYAPTKHTVRMDATTTLTNITAFRLELLNDPNLPMNGPGRSFKGTSALTEFNVEAAPKDQPTNKSKIRFASASSDYEQPDRPLEPDFYDKSTNNRITGPVRYAIDGNGNTAWGIDAGPGLRNIERKAVFVCATNITFNSGAALTFRLTQNHGGWNSDEHMNNNLGRFRLSATSATGPIVADPLPKRVRDILNIPRDKRSASQRAALFAYWRTTVSEFAPENNSIAKLWADYPEGSSALTLIARETPRTTQILKRGDFLKPVRPVTPGVPAFLHPLDSNAPPTRLTLARWLVDRRSPTTARVIVNRVWQAYFGLGLVATPEDLGLQSETPSNQALLDWLACDFMDSGWSLKHLHRVITSSATYRQSSKIAPDAYAKDPYNRELARGARFRVQGEIVRDITLAASGLLNPKVGGRSVMPPAPAYLFMPPVSYAPFEWNDETGSDRYRRALYTFRRRSTPYPMLQTFDVPNADAACVRRARSDTPLQALMMLNETVSMEAAQAMALRVLNEAGPGDDDRITYAFRLCVSRKPTSREQKELQTFLQAQSKRFAEGWLEAPKLAYKDADHPPKLPPNATPTQLATWTALSRALLNLDETITKE